MTTLPLTAMYGAPPGNWVADAACRGHNDLMVADNKGNHRQALALCNECPVADDCYQWALTVPDPATGMIAAGMLPNQRQAVRRNLGTRRPGPAPQPIRHGTRNGVDVHRKRGEAPCEACRDAYNRWRTP